jgi:hypothetical protein
MDLPGPCGGGGTFTKARNSSYGLDIEDPWGGLDYINRFVGDPPGDGTLKPWDDVDPVFSLVKPLTGQTTLVDC